jgi:hypothetical protein
VPTIDGVKPFELHIRQNFLAALCVGDGKKDTFVDIYDLAPPGEEQRALSVLLLITAVSLSHAGAAQMPRHIHRVIWQPPAVKTSIAVVSADGELSPFNDEAARSKMHVTLVGEQLWMAQGPSLLAWSLIEQKRTARATKVSLASDW